MQKTLSQTKKITWSAYYKGIIFRKFKLREEITNMKSKFDVRK